MALAGIKDRQGWTPPEIADFLQELLEHHDNGRNLYNADTFLTAVVSALGRLKVGAEQACARSTGKQLQVSCMQGCHRSEAEGLLLQKCLALEKRTAIASLIRGLPLFF